MEMTGHYSADDMYIYIPWCEVDRSTVSGVVDR